MVRRIPTKQIQLDTTNNETLDRQLAHIDENFNLLFSMLGISDIPGAVSRAGTFTALTGGGPVTVANTNVTANSQIIITLKTAGGTVGGSANVGPVVKTITPGTGFTVDNQATDTSVYNYLIIG